VSKETYELELGAFETTSVKNETAWRPALG